MLSVLFLENNALYAQVVVDLLARGGGKDLSITHQRTLAGALTCLGRDAFDVVVLDLDLPDQDPLGAMESLLREAPSVAVVVLRETEDDSGQAEQAINRGAHDCLEKDRLTMESLRRAIRYAALRQEFVASMGPHAALSKTVLDGLQDGVVVLAARKADDGSVVDFGFRFVNRAGAALLGMPGREMAAIGFRATARASGLGGHFHALINVLVEGRPWSTQVSVDRGNARTWVRMTASRLGEGLALTLADLTPRIGDENRLRAALDEAREAHATNSRLLAAISHEARTPLNTIAGFGEMIHGEVLGPLSNGRYREYAGDIVRAARQLEQLIGDLLDRKRYEDMARDLDGHRLMIDLAPDLICVIDGEGRISSINPAGATLLGTDAGAMRWAALASWIHPDYLSLLHEDRELLLSERGPVPAKLLRADGRAVEVELTAVDFTDRSDPTGRPSAWTLVVARDVSERQRATRKLATSEQWLRKIMETMVDALVVIDETGRVETFNPAAERMFGWTADEIVGKTVNVLMGEDDSRHHDAYMLAYRRTEQSRAVGVGRELEARHKHGRMFPIELALSDVRLEGQRRFIGVIRDISERKRQEGRLMELATRDPLTGLPNRTLFRRRLEQAMAQADLDGGQVALLFIDLDHFKRINDTLGHVAGDKVICQAAERLETHAAPGGDDTVAHQGGDEFTMIMTGIPSREVVRERAERVLRDLSRPFVAVGREVYISASIGVGFYPDDGADIPALLKNVDTAVHHAKRLGRDRVTVYDNALSAEMVRRLLIETGLRRALERDEFTLHYQPKVDLARGMVMGAEALLRWTSQDLGPVSPAEFVPVAEETGLVESIGEWVLRQACRQAAGWQAEGLPTIEMGVNLSARQFRDPRLAERVDMILREEGMDPHYLDLELTESMLVDNAEHAVMVLESLKALGLRLSIDDFGTGYSSLSYLKRFPIDTLKIDRSFVMDIPTSPDDVAITQAIIRMASALRLTLVAEGIETAEQMDFLRANGCHLGQGFFYSRPVPADQFRLLLQALKDGRSAPGHVDPTPVTAQP